MEGLDGHAKVEFEGLMEDFSGCCSRFSVENGEEEMASCLLFVVRNF